MSVYNRLIRYIKPYKSRFLSAMVCMIGIGLLTSFLMWLIKPVLNDIFADKKVNMILPLGGLIVLITFLKGIFTYVQSYLMAYIGQRIVLDIRNQLFNHMSYLCMDFYGKYPTGKLISRLTNDISIIQMSLTNLPGNAIRDGVTLISLTVLAFYLNWKLAFIAIFVFPLAMLPVVKFGKKLRSVSKKGQQQMAKVYNVLYESILGIKVVKAFGLEEFRKKIFGDENINFFNITMRSMRVLSMTSPVMEFIGAIGIAAIIVIGGYQVTGGDLTQGDFFAFIGAIVSLYAPVKNLSNFNNTLQQSLAAATRIFNILDTKSKISQVSNAPVLRPIKNNMVFDNVSFRYDESRMVLDRLSFEVKKGEMVAFVGPSGGGKSTIMSLLLRFYDPVEGKILIDGQDISKISLKSLRDQTGLVTQDIVLFNDTVAQNIRYGSLNKSDEDIIEAAKAANAHEFIMTLQSGYDTVIGEQGSKLSGGQRQRLALARAILKDPKILILDEATSALDSESERLVQGALEELVKDRTTFVIAHRLSTIRKADKLFVIEEGKIVEQGVHEELLKLEGLYAKLHNIQFEV